MACAQTGELLVLFKNLLTQTLLIIMSIVNVFSFLNFGFSNVEFSSSSLFGNMNMI